VGFCAFTHAFYMVHGKIGCFWSEIIPKTFSTLIAVDLPSDLGEMDVFERFLTYVAVLVFSMFVLNIFIGVIGEQYEVQKERCPIIFQHRRATACFNFLIRAKVLPCTLLSRRLALVVQALAVGSMLALQFEGLRRGSSLPWTKSSFILCQLVTLFCAYQNPKAPWTKATTGNCCSVEKSYLWLVVPRKSKVHCKMDEVKEMVLQLQNALLGKCVDNDTSLTAHSQGLCASIV